MDPNIAGPASPDGSRTAQSAPPSKRPRYRVARRASAELLAGFSGMPFAQNGFGSALTASNVISVPPSAVEQEPSSMLPHDADATTHPTVAAPAHGLIVSILPGHIVAPNASVVRGKKGAVAKGPKVMAARPTVGFPQLPTSEIFLGKLRTDAQELLETFQGNWLQSQARGSSDSIVGVFEDAWLEKGWQYSHIALGEDSMTRQSFHDIVARTFLDTLSEPTRTVLWQVGVLLSLYVFWATSPPRLDTTLVTIAEPPSLVADGNVEEAMWTERIGRGWPINIEADQLARLLRLPTRCMELSINGDDSPSDDVRAVLTVLRDAHAFQILPPTAFAARTPRTLPHTRLVSVAQAARTGGLWGRLGPMHESSAGLSRSEQLCANLSMHLFDSGFFPSDDPTAPLPPSWPRSVEASSALADRIPFKGIRYLRALPANDVLSSDWIQEARREVAPSVQDVVELAERKAQGPGRAERVADVLSALDALRGHPTVAAADDLSAILARARDQIESAL